jgi:hypothetical protein
MQGGIMRKEYCCTQCGLIWFDKNSNEIECPECANHAIEDIFLCDSSAWFEAYTGVILELQMRNKRIHYHKIVKGEGE